MTGLSLLLLAALQLPEVIAVRSEPVANGLAVKILTTSALANLDVDRHGESAVVALAAKLPPQPLELPPAMAPLRSIAVEADQTQTRFRLSWAPGSTFESRVEGSLVTLLFRNDGQAPASRDVERLYPMLFPPSDAPSTTAPQNTPALIEAESHEGGLALGPLRVKPSFVARYVDTTATLLETPQPLGVQYLEIQPALTIATGSAVEGARLTLNYEPRFRTSQRDIAALSEPSHFFAGAVDFPVGSSVRVAVSDRMHRATLETEVLDPGREYFYDLGRFRRNELGVTAQSDRSGRFDFDLGGSRVSETVERGSGYFDNVRENVFVGPRYELGPASNLSLRYQFERVPPLSVRPVVESRAHAVVVGFDGQVATMLEAIATVGFRSERYPRAAAPGDSFQGVTLSATLKRNFVNGASLVLGAGRSPYLSAFEANAFYVANRVDGSLVIPMPATLWLSLGVRRQWNDYRQRATGLAVPREDRLSGWTAGLSRNVTSWSSIRADYSWDRRLSNIPGLTTRTHSFVAQVGVGGLRPAVGR